ncbi:hypothetical protein BH11MYX1_BH11MYX1_52880 [soil metagenome]
MKSRAPARWLVSTEHEVARSGHCALIHYEREEARRTLRHGAVLLVSLPVVVMALVGLGVALHSYGPALIGFVYTVVAGPSGIVMVGLGIVQYRIASKKLAALDRNRLPEARLLR